MLISQRRMSVDRFTRQPDGDWILATYSTVDQEVVFPSLNVSIPMTSLYLKVELPSSPSLKDDGTESGLPSPS